MRGLTPELTAMALLVIVYAWRNRRTLFGPVRGAPVWYAALIGGRARARWPGALFNDSGPILLLYGTVMLAFVTAYLRRDPRPVVRRHPRGDRGGAPRSPVAQPAAPVPRRSPLRVACHAEKSGAEALGASATMRIALVSPTRGPTQGA